MQTKFGFSMTQEATEDMYVAEKYYKSLQVNGLSKRFSADIRNAIKRACKNPYAFAVRFDNVRMVRPDSFPFSIHFLIDEQIFEIIIVAVLHERANF